MLLLSAPVWAGARYKLAYRVTANDLIKMVAKAADLTKWESKGEEVLVEGSKLKVWGEKSGFILDHATNVLILLDHETKSYERTTPAVLKQRIADDFPPGIQGILRTMYPANGKAATEVRIDPFRMAEPAEMRSLQVFRQKYGLSYLLPGVDTIIAFTPHIEKQVEAVGKGQETPVAMRFAIGKDGHILDAVVEVRDYREERIPASAFEPPKDYRDVDAVPIN